MTGIFPYLQNRNEQLKQVIALSIPAILAQISSIAMQYIDAAMVGSMGAQASASIGLVSTTTWLMNGFCISAATGYSVQVAHMIGAKKEAEAKNVFRQSLITTLLMGLLLAAIGVAISSRLPVWLGGEADILKDATSYFLIYATALPAVQIRQLTSSMLQCSGNMRTPSMLNAMMCGFDVIFNWFLIFPSIHMPELGITIPRADMGVAGAALGTALAEWVTASLMLFAACVRSPKLRLIRQEGAGSWRLTRECSITAARIALPMAFERTILSGAQIASTRIVSPLGTISIAANSLAVTAESLCYMPGFGIATAATTLVGQSLGAKDKQQARQFARLSVGLAVFLMSIMGVLMFFLAPFVFRLLTPDPEVQELGVRVLRIEAFAEPLYAVSIAAAGVMRGAGDTLIPSILNLVSMWGVRITTAALLAPHLGLTGVWIAMCGELCFRGILFLIRLLREKWLENGVLAR